MSTSSTPARAACSASVSRKPLLLVFTLCASHSVRLPCGSQLSGSARIAVHSASRSRCGTPSACTAMIHCSRNISTALHMLRKIASQRSPARGTAPPQRGAARDARSGVRTRRLVTAISAQSAAMEREACGERWLMHGSTAARRAHLSCDANLVLLLSKARGRRRAEHGATFACMSYRLVRHICGVVRVDSTPSNSNRGHVPPLTSLREPPYESQNLISTMRDYDADPRRPLCTWALRGTTPALLPCCPAARR